MECPCTGVNTHFCLTQCPHEDNPIEGPDKYAVEPLGQSFDTIEAYSMSEAQAMLELNASHTPDQFTLTAI